MKVSDIMTANVMTLKPTDKLEYAASVLCEHRFNGLPVVDEAGKLLGLIAERDFISPESQIYLPTYIKMLQDMDYVHGDKRSLPEEVTRVVNATVNDVMNRDIVAVSKDMDLQELTEIFATKRVNPVPVVNSEKKLLGIVARSDLIKFFAIQHVKA